VLRRAFRRGSLLGASGPFLYRLVIAVVNIMKDGYPELVNHSGHVAKVVKLEEERFQETLSKGLSLLDEIMSSLSSKKIIPGKEAFKLFDTYGFPLELTVEEAVSRGWTVDTDEFELEMKTQKNGVVLFFRPGSATMIRSYLSEKGFKPPCLPDTNGCKRYQK